MNTIEEMKAATKNTAAEFLLGELIKASSKRFKALEKPFYQLKESQQSDLLQDVAADVRDAVREAVEIIASDYRVVLRAMVDSVQFKSDGVKANLVLANSMQAHALADVAGGSIMIVIEDSSRYLSVGDAIDAVPDQSTLI